MTAAEVKQRFGLAPHPCEGGWYIRTYEAEERMHLARYGSPRRTGTAIYYLLEPHTFSEMHRLQSDEIFHFYAGDPVEMLQLLPEGIASRTILANDLSPGTQPQVTVPRGVWQGSRLVEGGRWALLGCTVSPGFEYEDYEAGVRAGLAAHWPDWRLLIEALTHA